MARLCGLECSVRLSRVNGRIRLDVGSPRNGDRSGAYQPGIDIETNHPERPFLTRPLKPFECLVNKVQRGIVQRQIIRADIPLLRKIEQLLKDAESFRTPPAKGICTSQRLHHFGPSKECDCPFACLDGLTGHLRLLVCDREPEVAEGKMRIQLNGLSELADREIIPSRNT